MGRHYRKALKFGVIQQLRGLIRAYYQRWQWEKGRDK